MILVLTKDVKSMHERVKELITIKKINAVKNLNAGKKLCKPAVPT